MGFWVLVALWEFTYGILLDDKYFGTYLEKKKFLLVYLFCIFFLLIDSNWGDNMHYKL